MEERQDCG